MKSTQHWAGIISCHNDEGWYPAATFVDGRGECGLQDHINATAIDHLKHEIHRHYGKSKRLFIILTNSQTRTDAALKIPKI